jgi:hypothetical protein
MFRMESPQYEVQEPRTYTHRQDRSELHNFEDKVDDLLSETRNYLDDFSPQPGMPDPNFPQPQAHPDM